MKRPREIEPTFRQMLGATTPPPEIQAIINQEVGQAEFAAAMVREHLKRDVATFFLYNGSDINLSSIRMAISEIAECDYVEETFRTIGDHTIYDYTIRMVRGVRNPLIITAFRVLPKILFVAWGESSEPALN